VSQDKQLALFPAGTSARRPVTREHLVLARRVTRTARARGPLLVKDLAMILGADLGDVWLAVGIARQWRRVEVRDGIVALAVPHEEGAA
jgi:hypothetical protein